MHMSFCSRAAHVLILTGNVKHIMSTEPCRSNSNTEGTDSSMEKILRIDDDETFMRSIPTTQKLNMSNGVNMMKLQKRGHKDIDNNYLTVK